MDTRSLIVIFFFRIWFFTILLRNDWIKYWHNDSWLLNYVDCIFSKMKICHKCNNKIEDDFFVGRQSQCPSCEADLHCCLNCSFYEIGEYNDCRESQAERVLDKSRSNFCDFFSFKQKAETTGATDSSTKDKLDALFKNKWAVFLSNLFPDIAYEFHKKGVLLNQPSCFTWENKTIHVSFWTMSQRIYAQNNL